MADALAAAVKLMQQGTQGLSDFFVSTACGASHTNDLMGGNIKRKGSRCRCPLDGDMLSPIVPNAPTRFCVAAFFTKHPVSVPPLHTLNSKWLTPSTPDPMTVYMKGLSNRHSGSCMGAVASSRNVQRITSRRATASRGFSSATSARHKGQLG